MPKRVTEWAEKLNIQIIEPKVQPGQQVYRLYDFFTTRDGSWEVKPGLEYGIPQWARDTYLRPWGAADYFDDAGADHHIFGAVVNLADLKTIKKNTSIFYRTWPDNKLVLIAGLWAEPNMAMRLHREPSAGVDQKKLSRFVADCELRFVGKVDSVKVRWSPGQPWQPEGGAMIARPVSCKLSEE